MSNRNQESKKARLGIGGWRLVAPAPSLQPPIPFRRIPFAQVLNFAALLGCLLALCWLTGCASSHAEQAKSPPPAKVEHAVKEADLATIKLTPEAEKRLGITTAAIELRDVPRTLDISGEIVTPQGNTMTVTAPMTGTLQPAQNRSPFVGQFVQKGQTLFRLTPFLAPERDLRVQIERDIAALKERIVGIKQRKERAEALAKENAGPVRA
ncbi:MAG TPA: hypothetical protein VFZ34_05860, partial [Blastocatellia bacterium]|nr:hypothetical protein [Blastocatellia bacterium]